MHQETSTTPNTGTRQNAWTHGCKIFIQCWAGVWQMHRENTEKEQDDDHDQDSLEKSWRLKHNSSQHPHWIKSISQNLGLETFLAGAVQKGISGSHANSDDFPWKNPQKSIIIRVFRPFVLIMMDFCGFFQGKSSEFA